MGRLTKWPHFRAHSRQIFFCWICSCTEWSKILKENTFFPLKIWLIAINWIQFKEKQWTHWLSERAVQGHSQCLNRPGPRETASWHAWSPSSETRPLFSLGFQARWVELVIIVFIILTQSRWRSPPPSLGTVKVAESRGKLSYKKCREKETLLLLMFLSLQS